MFFKKTFLSMAVVIACTSLHIQADIQKKKEPTLKDEAIAAGTDFTLGVFSLFSAGGCVYNLLKKDWSKPSHKDEKINLKLISSFVLPVVGLSLLALSVKHSLNFYSLCRADQNKKDKKIEKEKLKNFQPTHL